MANKFLGPEFGGDNPLMVGNVQISFVDQSVQDMICLSITYSGKQIEQLDTRKTYGLSIKLVPA